MTFGRILKGRRRWMKPMVLVPILALIALASWALSSPVGSSPDDDFHLPSIWCATGPKADACAVDPTHANARLVPTDLVINSVCYAYKPNTSAGVPGRGLRHPSQRAELDVAGGTSPVSSIRRSSTWAMSPFVGPNIDVSVVTMRLVNSVLFVALFVALFLLLPSRRRPTLVLAAAVTLVPLGMFLIPSTNPSSWAVVARGHSLSRDPVVLRDAGADGE